VRSCRDKQGAAQEKRHVGAPRPFTRLTPDSALCPLASLAGPEPATAVCLGPPSTLYPLWTNACLVCPLWP
jgi:hypothetical protein